MRKASTLLMAVLLALPALWAESKDQKPALSKRPPSPAKAASSAGKHKRQSPNRVYAQLTISELVAEDPNRWTEKMRTHAAVSGFVTQVRKEENGDTNTRICDNPKVEGMDRAHCFVAKCIPRLPCEVPRIGKPTTVSGITRYDAEVGHHWWEIHPVERVEK
jgi:hypothetical protein